MKRVLVTGATGYIGSHTLPFLQERGFEIHALSSRPVNAQFALPRAAGANPIWHTADLLNEGAASVISKIKATHLLHLAWFAVPGAFWTSAENLRWLSASLRLLEDFAQGGGTRVAVAGTCAEYDWRYGYCQEFLTPCVPATLYGECKRSLASIVEKYSGLSNLHAAWGRIFWLYGGREHSARLVPSVIQSLLKGNPVLCTHGNQIRDFLHVEDVASALVAMLDSDIRGPVNICSGMPVPVKDVISHLARVVKMEDCVRYGAIPSEPSEPPLVIGRRSRLECELNWKPKIELTTGLNATIEFWRSAQLPADSRSAIPLE